MQTQKAVFYSIALAVSALLSTGALAQSTVEVATKAAGGATGITLGYEGLTIYDSNTQKGVAITDQMIIFTGTANGTTNGTLIHQLGIQTSSIVSSGAGDPLRFMGAMDFSGAAVTGLTGLFDPAQVRTPLTGVTGSGVSSALSGYSIDLVTGAAALGATITNGITNIGNIGTSTLSTIGNANVGGELAVTGATTLNGATTVNNTLNVNGATTLVGATSITGATNINTTGTAATAIGNATAAATLVGNVVSATAGNSGLALQNGEARLTVTNSLGNTHGLVVGESSTTLSGGTRSTNLTLNDNGASFSNAATGAPVRVTGVANGSGDFDAVNVRQFSSAVAGVAASANIPGVDTNKTSSVGVGLGSFMNSQALAFGGSYRFSDKGVLRASLATGLNSGGSKTSFGIGAGWSW